MRQPDHIDHQHHFIDYLIRYYEDHFRIDDAIGWSYDREGHSFYVVNFPTAGVMLVSDQTLREWHRRGFSDTDLARGADVPRHGLR